MKTYITHFVLLVTITTHLTGAPSPRKWPQKMVINVPITHLMSKPAHRNPTYEKCGYQATQVIFGEHVIAHEEHKGWLRVQAIEQEAFWNNKWIQCSGWIEKEHAVAVTDFAQENIVVASHIAPLYEQPSSNSNHKHILSFGSRLKAKKVSSQWWHVELAGQPQGYLHEQTIAPLDLTSASTESLRKTITQRSLQFLGDPYVWAGRSSYYSHSKMICGTDCSGLMNLLHRSVGIDIPRCAHDQLKRSVKLTRLDPKRKGDLMFMYYENSEKPGTFNDRVNHVMMYLGNDRLIESEGDLSGHVRVVIGRQRFGKPVESLVSGETTWQYKKLAESPLGNKKVIAESPIGKCIVAFGSFLP
jgi:cell wall-associated NlpC family hydrolase